jgi:hypothetical protein
MIRQAVTHLLPRSQPVAIRTEQAKVSLVCRPVLQSVVPVTRAFSLFELFARVNVVNVENSVVAISALRALPAQCVHDRNLARPVARFLVFLEAVFVPVILAAFFRTKAMLAFTATAFTPTFPLPACFKIAVSTAIFTRPVFEAVLMGFKRCGAVAASDCYRCLFHGLNIRCKRAKVNFEIACKRIEEAQKQGDMFIEQPAQPKPQQTGLDLGDAA